MSEMRSKKTGDSKEMVAEYLKARVGKPEYTGPTESVNEKGPGSPAPASKKSEPEMNKESMELTACPKCKDKNCLPGQECCARCRKGMEKESAYLYRKAVDILKTAMAPPPGAMGGAPEGPPGPPPGMPPGAGGPPPPPPGGEEGGPPGLLPLPVLLQQLQVYMQMQQGGQGGPPPGMPPGAGGPPPGMPPGAGGPPPGM